MLTAHSSPVFFGAATVRQDSQLVNGKWVSMNPTHVNEQPSACRRGLRVRRRVRRAAPRRALADPGYQKAPDVPAWWYAELLVFRRVTSAADRAALDAELRARPPPPPATLPPSSTAPPPAA